MNKDFEIITKTPLSERDMTFRESISRINLDQLNDNELIIIFELYNQIKDITLRHSILKKLYSIDRPFLKKYMLAIYKKERYLDMKLFAIRGLALYSNEIEITKLMDKFLEILIRRVDTTPYNYQEYELLRAQNGLPYLIKKYNYECFKRASHQVDIQYDAMPDAFKGHFTYDESGNLVQLRSPETTKKMMEDFWNKHRNSR